MVLTMDGFWPSRSSCEQREENGDPHDRRDRRSLMFAVVPRSGGITKFTVVPAVIGEVVIAVALLHRLVNYPIVIVINVRVHAREPRKRAALATGHDAGQETVADHATSGVTLEGCK